MIIGHTAFGLPICTLIMRNIFSAVPMAIREAAIIDGANEFDVLIRIMLPISLPALAVWPLYNSPGSGMIFFSQLFSRNLTAFAPLWLA